MTVGLATPTLKRLPGVDDAVAVAVEEGGVLLKHGQAAGVASPRPLRVARVHRLQSPREICKTNPECVSPITALLIARMAVVSPS